MSSRGGKRTGAGRPREIQHRVSLTVFVEREIRNAAKTKAATEGVTLGAVVRRALSRFVRRTTRRGEKPQRRRDGAT